MADSEALRLAAQLSYLSEQSRGFAEEYQRRAQEFAKESRRLEEQMAAKQREAGEARATAAKAAAALDTLKVTGQYNY